MFFLPANTLYNVHVDISQFASGINSVHIVQIEGPEVVKAGAELRLDCDYDYMAEEEPQLDLKWYFNKSPIPVICNIVTSGGCISNFNGRGKSLFF